MIMCGGWELFPDLVQLEAACSAIGFYRILKRLYLETGDYRRILACFLHDRPERQATAS
jgi:hypothetical protein